MTEGMDALRQPTSEEISKFRSWAVGSGRYALSTTARMVRRVRQLSKIFDLESLKVEQLWDYVEAQLKSGKKAKSINNEMKDLRGWLLFKGTGMELPRLRTPPSPEPEIPTDEQVMALLDRQLARPSRSAGIRDRAIMEVLAFGGLRIGELTALNIEDYSHGALRVRSEKGEMERKIPLPAFVQSDINEYIGHHRFQSGNSLFTTPKGRMTYPYARKMIKDQATKAGVPWLHAHSLRHYCATTLAAADMNLKKVQIHLGHKSIRSTEAYANLRQSTASREVASFFDARFRWHGAEKKGFEPEGAIMDEPAQLLSGGCGIETVLALPGFGEVWV